MKAETGDRPLRLAVLGSRPELLPLARAAATDPRFEIARLYEVGDLQTELLTLAPAAKLGDNWEELANLNDLDGVLFGATFRDSDGAVQLKRLAREGAPLIVVQPPCEPIDALEIEMIQRDVKNQMLSWNSDWEHPLVADLTALAAQSTEDDSLLGPIDRVVIERQIPADSSLSTAGQFACDAYLIQQTIGRIAEVQAMGSGVGNLQLPASVSVHMTAASGILAQWNASVTNEPLAEITLLGARGKATLAMPADGNWKLTTSDGVTEQASTPEEAAVRCLMRLSKAETPGAYWSDACRSLEVLDAAEFSLKRGKTTLITDERPTEEATFKGMMAAGGCGLLLYTFFAFIGALMIDAAKPSPFEAEWWPTWWPTGYWPAWPWWVFAPIAVFLLLQFLQLVFQSKPKD